MCGRIGHIKKDCWFRAGGEKGPDRLPKKKGAGKGKGDRQKGTDGRWYKKTGTGGTLDSWTLDDDQNDDVGSLTMTEEEDDDYWGIHSFEIYCQGDDSDDEGLDSITMLEPPEAESESDNEESMEELVKGIADKEAEAFAKPVPATPKTTPTTTTKTTARLLQFDGWTVKDPWLEGRNRDVPWLAGRDRGGGMDRLLELTAKIQGQPQVFGIGTPNQLTENSLSPEAFARIVGEESEYMSASDFEKLVETAESGASGGPPVVKGPAKAPEAFATATTTSRPSRDGSRSSEGSSGPRTTHR